MKATTNYTVGMTVKLDDFGTVREYRIVKSLYSGELQLQSAGVIGFTATPEWLDANKLS